MAPFAWVGVGVTAGVASAAALDRVEAIAVGGVLLVLGALVACRWRPALLVAGLALGLVASGGLAEGPELSGRVTLVGVVVGAPVGAWADVAVSRVVIPGSGWTEREGRVRVRFPDSAPPPGAHVTVYGRAMPLVDAVSGLPGAPDPALPARAARVRSAVLADAAAALGGSSVDDDPFAGRRNRGLLRALALGDRRDVSEATWDVLRATGTTHLVAISGLHVGLLAIATGGLLRRAGRALSVVWPRGLPEGWTWLVGAAVALVFTWDVGAPVSAQRSVAGLAAVAVARAAGRDVDGLGATGFAALLVLIVDPAAAATPGFQLSFGAVVGMLRVGPALMRFVPPDLPWPARWLVEGTTTTIAATLGSLPAVGWWFQEVALTSVPANLVVAPIVTLWVTPCAIVAAWAGGLGGPFAAAADLGLDVSGWLLDRVAGPMVPVAFGPEVALLAFVAVLIARLDGWLVVAVAAGLQVGPPPDGLRVTVLDVGQGTAVVVEDSAGARWVVDGGPPGVGVLRWLRRRGGGIDVMVATHGHPDHTGGLTPLVGALPVGVLWIPDREGMGELIAAASAARVPVVERPALAWSSHVARPDLNDRSLVLTLGDGPGRVLLPGDLDGRGERALAPWLVPHAALVVPHHGSRFSSTDPFLDAVAPVVAVIGVGRRNLYRHPSPAALDRYAARGVHVYRTDQDGTIELWMRDDGVWARAWRPGRATAGYTVHPLPSVGLAGAAGPDQEDGERDDGDQQRQAL
jgi:competence protein ComEC